MNAAKLCHTCNRIAANTCGMCGRQACGEHFDSKLGICAECKKGRR